MNNEINTGEVFSQINGQHAGHRGPYSAGGADRYYGRPYAPNFTYHGYQYAESEMTPEQIEEYRLGWNQETDRKDWGFDSDDVQLETEDE